MSAGEHLSDEVLAQWRERFGLDIYEAVGMSEFSLLPLAEQAPPDPPRLSAGFPQPGHDVRLLDPETLREVARRRGRHDLRPRDRSRASSSSTGTCPRRRRSCEHDGWFFTGDYARYDEDGYLWFLGRKDDIIKSFGYRVSPYEVERVLKGAPGGRRLRVRRPRTSERDKLLVVAYVIPQPGRERSTPDELLAFGREHLAAYKAPKVVYLARDFPRTRNGKILRREISPALAIGALRAMSFARPLTVGAARRSAGLGGRRVDDDRRPPRRS